MEERTNMEMLKTKRELLEHYATKKPTPFKQWDGFDLGDNIDDCMHSDKDGHCIMIGLTTELMTSKPEVRVLVPAGAGVSAATAATLLRKIANLIEQGCDQNIGANWPWKMKPYEPNEQLRAEGIVGKRVRQIDAPEREESYGVVTRAMGGMVVVLFERNMVWFEGDDECTDPCAAAASANAARPLYLLEDLVVHPDDKNHPVPGRVQMTVTWTESVDACREYDEKVRRPMSSN
jgi:hypothetical protein